MKSHQILKYLLITASLLIMAFGYEIKGQDGNAYKIVKIGNQQWMAENLNESSFRNGDPIPEIKTHQEWIAADNEGKPAWCHYNGDPEYGKKYGKLYNWYAVNTGKLAPAGWHVPNQVEFITLQAYLIANGYNYDNTTIGNKIAIS